MKRRVFPRRKRAGAKQTQTTTSRRRNAKPRNSRDRRTQERVFHAIARMRREGLTASAAAKAEKTTLAAMKRFAATALRKDRRGNYRATSFDRIPRTLGFLTASGDVSITVRNSRVVSQIAQHKNAVKAFLRGDSSALAKFEGKSVTVDGVTYPFITDPDLLERLGSADLPDDKLYRSIQ